MAVWRLFVAVTGAFVLVIASAMALGFVSVSGQGVDVSLHRGDQSPPSAPAVPGRAGLLPGQAPSSVMLAVHNPGPHPVQVRSVVPDLGALPGTCPAASWRIVVPSALPVVLSGTVVALPLQVALVAEAPNTCQSLELDLPVRIEGTAAAGSAEGFPLTTVAKLTTATLGSPTAVIGTLHGTVSVTAVAPASGPTPQAYAVTVLDVERGTTTVCERTSVSCPDAATPAAAGRHYVVTALFGRHWIRPSPTVQTWTPPPAPSLRFVDPTSPTTSAVRLTAPGAANSYQVALFADGAVTAFHTEKVDAGDTLRRSITVPELGAGLHRVVAVSTFHDRSTSSAVLELSAAGASGLPGAGGGAATGAGTGTGTGTGSPSTNTKSAAPNSPPRSVSPNVPPPEPVDPGPDLGDSDLPPAVQEQQPQL